MKKKSSLLCLIALAAVLAVCAAFVVKPKTKTSIADMDPVKIKLAHGIPAGELAPYLVEDWMAEVSKRSGGKISFDYYPAGKLGSYVEIIEQVELGAVDMSIGEPSLFEPLCPEVSMLYAPLICDNYDHLGRCIYGKPGKLIAEAMSQKSNTYILGWASAGARVIASVRPLRTLADMKGLVIRSPESQVFIDTFTLFGMSPTPMAMNEMYKAIQMGVVEACECPAQSLYEGGYHKITGNICKTRHMYALATLSANEKFWDGLPEEARALMLQVWDELKGGFNKRIVDSENGYYAKFEAEGTKVTEFTDQEAFRKIAQPYWAEKAASIGGKANEILTAIDELREPKKK
ncbi:MAG: TRAP transporter substrate-binding protein [Synergistaceae bacterium]|nr:TRAP transporter substrate-binding protein [Synergistaceae bacterium]